MKTSKISVEMAKTQGDPSLKTAKTKKIKDTQNKIQINNITKDNKKESKIKQLLDIVNSNKASSKFDKVSLNMHSQPKEDNNINNNNITQKEQVSNSNINPNRLYLKNLPFEITDEELRNTFSTFGEISEILIPKNYQTNKSLGYAYITYQTIESSILALSEMDRKIYQGRILHICPANIQEHKETKQKKEFKKEEQKITSKLSEFK